MGEALTDDRASKRLVAAVRRHRLFWLQLAILCVVAGGFLVGALIGYPLYGFPGFVCVSCLVVRLWWVELESWGAWRG